MAKIFVAHLCISLQIDPSRINMNQKPKMSSEDVEKLIKKNYYRLILNIEAISYAIFKSVDKVPQ